MSLFNKKNYLKFNWDMKVNKTTSPTVGYLHHALHEVTGNATIVAKLTDTDIVQIDKFKVIVERTNLTCTEASM